MNARSETVKKIKRRRAIATESPLEVTLAFQLKAAGLPSPVRQFRFWPGRRYKADFAWPEQRLIVELEGGIYKRGWHQSIGGMLDDITKYNHMTLMGYRLLRFAGQHVKNGTALSQIEEALEIQSPIGFCRECNTNIYISHSEHHRQRHMEVSSCSSTTLP